MLPLGAARAVALARLCHAPNKFRTVNSGAPELIIPQNCLLLPWLGYPTPSAPGRPTTGSNALNATQDAKYEVNAGHVML
jgi:hypothetical protein